MKSLFFIAILAASMVAAGAEHGNGDYPKNGTTPEYEPGTTNGATMPDTGMETDTMDTTREGDGAAMPRENGAAIEQQIIEQERQWWNALESERAQLSRQNLADDFRYIGEAGMLSQQELIDMVNQGELDVQNYSLSELQVTQPASDVAVLTYTAEVTGMVEGREMAEKVYSSAVFAKQDGQWKRVFYQETPATEATEMQQGPQR
jgi:hypothetical protein